MEHERVDPDSCRVNAQERDRATGASVGETTAAVTDDVRVHVLDGCGHFPAEERPAPFLDAVLPFLRARA